MMPYSATQSNSASEIRLFYQIYSEKSQKPKDALLLQNSEYEKFSQDVMNDLEDRASHDEMLAQALENEQLYFKVFREDEDIIPKNAFLLRNVFLLPRYVLGESLDAAFIEYSNWFSSFIPETVKKAASNIADYTESWADDTFATIKRFCSPALQELANDKKSCSAYVDAPWEEITNDCDEYEPSLSVFQTIVLLLAFQGMVSSLWRSSSYASKKISDPIRINTAIFNNSVTLQKTIDYVPCATSLLIGSFFSTTGQMPAAFGLAALNCLNFAEAMTVVNPKPQYVDPASQVSLSYYFQDIFNSTDFTAINVTFANGTAIPWLTLQNTYDLVGNYNPFPIIMGDTIVRGDYAYLAVVTNDGAPERGLQIVDISNPSTPTLVSYVKFTLSNDADPPFFALNEDYACLALPTTPVAPWFTNLQVVNIANVSNPQLVSNISFSGSPGNIVINRNYAYLTSTIMPNMTSESIIGALEIVDISHPNNLSLVNTFPSNHYPARLTVSGNYAYLCSNSATLLIIDISNASTPYLVSNFTFLCSSEDWCCGGLALRNNHAYIGTNTGLQIVDISNPRTPYLLGNFPILPPRVYEITLDKNNAYVAYSEGVQVLDISNSNSPALIGTYLTHTAGQVSLNENNAFITGGDGLTIIGLDRKKMVLAGFSPFESLRLDLSVIFQDTHKNVVSVPFVIYVDSPPVLKYPIADRHLFPGNSLLIPYRANNFFDKSDSAFMSLSLIPSNNKNMPAWLNYKNKISLLGSYSYSAIGINNGSGRILIKGKSAYITYDSSDGYSRVILIVDISTLDMPQLMGTYSASNATCTNTNLAIKNNYLYLPTCENLLILDISNPGTPTLTGSIQGRFNNIQIDGNNAYLFYVNDFRIFDISNSTTPHLISNISIPNGPLYGTGCFGFIVRGRYVYLSCEDNFQILDIYNPARPLLVGNLDFPPPGMYSNGIALRGNNAYLASWGIFQILDISNPSSPRPIGSCQLAAVEVERTILAGNNAYITTFDQGLFIVDISNSSKPSLIVRYPASSSDAALSGNSLYVSTQSGLQILDIGQWVLSGTPAIADAGTTTFNLVATDTFGSQASGSFKIVVEGSPLLMGTISPQTATTGKYFSYFLPQNIFVDPNDYVLTFNANLKNNTQLPSWLSFNQNSAIFGGTPNPEDVGNYEIVLQASNRVSAPTPTTFNLHVKNSPRATSIDQQVAQIGDGFNYTIPDAVFTDEPGSVLTYQALLDNGSNLPSWLQFFSQNKTFLGMPGKTAAGTLAIRVTAEDAYDNSVYSVFTLIVNAGPQIQPDLLARIENQTAFTAKPFRYSLPSGLFVDMNGLRLSYRAQLPAGNELPVWLNFDAVTMRFFGTPTLRYSGIWEIEITAVDPYEKSAVVTFELTMPNQAPVVVNQIVPQQAQIGKEYLMVMSVYLFKDPDGNDLTYHAQLLGGKPLSESGWLTFDSVKREFRGTPSLIPFQNTPVDVEIIASDGVDRTSTSFRIDVGVTDVLNKISQYYLTTGAAMVLIWALLKNYRVKKLLPEISRELRRKKLDLRNLIAPEKILRTQVTEEMLENMFTRLIPSIMAKTKGNHKTLESHMKAFLDAARVYYVYQRQGSKESLFNVGDLWVMIEMMAKEIKELCVGNKKDKKSAILWSKLLVELMNLVFFIEMEGGRSVLRDNKEKLGTDIRYLLRRVNVNSAEELELRFNLEIIKQSLANMAHTNQTMGELLLEIAHMMVVPIYGIQLVLELRHDLPEKWYVVLVYQHELGKMLMSYAKDPLDLLKLDVFGKTQDVPQSSNKEYLLMDDQSSKELTPTESTDWRYIYGLLDSLVEIAKSNTTDPEIQQKVMSILECYQNFAAFKIFKWRNEWIKTKALEITRPGSLSSEETRGVNNFFSSMSATLLACCSTLNESSRRCGTSFAQLLTQRPKREQVLGDLTSPGEAEGGATPFRLQT